MNKIQKLFIRLFIYEYKVKIKKLNQEQRLEIVSNLYKNNIRFTYNQVNTGIDTWMTQNYIFGFKNEIDAVEFKLLWL